MGHFSGVGWVGKWEASRNRGVNTRCLKEVWVERKGELHREEKGYYELIETIQERQSDE